MSTESSKAKASSPLIRRIHPSDRPALAALIVKDGLFTPPELKVSLELIDGALADPDGDYRVLVAEVADLKGLNGPAAPESTVAGYVCYGPSPMTEGTWDLYWIVTHPEARGRGVAGALVGAMEAELSCAGARLIRVETSEQELYEAAHRFYVRYQYPEVARLDDFYKPGDALIIMVKRLSSAT